MALPSESQYIPHIAYDSVIFGFSGNELKILVMEYHNTGLFALPGGFVGRHEDLDTAVRRGLKERTGLDKIHLEQFHAFGNMGRFKPAVMQHILAANGYEVPENHWMLGRFFSIAYYALINYEKVVPQPDALSDSIAWYPVNRLPELILDHNQILNKALSVLRDNLDKQLVRGQLLPDRFTMKELQLVYEAILGTEFRRTSFQRKILAMEILERHEKRFTGKSHKAPFLYSFKSDT